jgi:hypothetical protein
VQHDLRYQFCACEIDTMEMIDFFWYLVALPRRGSAPCKRARSTCYSIRVLGSPVDFESWSPLVWRLAAAPFLYRSIYHNKIWHMGGHWTSCVLAIARGYRQMYLSTNSLNK